MGNLQTNFSPPMLYAIIQHDNAIIQYGNVLIQYDNAIIQ